MDRQSREFARRELLKRVAEEPAFRAELLQDARAAIKRAFDYDLPPGFEVTVLEDAPERLYVLLPPAPPPRDSDVTLREITGDTVRAVCGLEVRPEQQRFVAP